MKKLTLPCILAGTILCSTSIAGATTLIDLTDGKGDSEWYGGAYFLEFDDADQFSVSSGTGVIDPFLTIQKKNTEEGFNSDYSPLVLDTTRPMWNHSIQISDLVSSPDHDLGDYFEFLLDINEPDGDKSLITQHELEVYVAPNAAGGSLSTLADVISSSTLVWDLNSFEAGGADILYDYGIWNGSGQNIDTGFYLDKDLFSSFGDDDYVYLYAKFGNPGEPSGDGFEEYILREGGTSVPEPTSFLLFGTGIAGIAGLRLRRKK